MKIGFTLDLQRSTKKNESLLLFCEILVEYVILVIDSKRKNAVFRHKTLKIFKILETISTRRILIVINQNIKFLRNFKYPS